VLTADHRNSRTRRAVGNPSAIFFLILLPRWQCGMEGAGVHLRIGREREGSCDGRPLVRTILLVCVLAAAAPRLIVKGSRRLVATSTGHDPEGKELREVVAILGRRRGSRRPWSGGAGRDAACLRPRGSTWRSARGYCSPTRTASRSRRGEDRPQTWLKQDARLFAELRAKHAATGPALLRRKPSWGWGAAWRARLRDHGSIVEKETGDPAERRADLGILKPPFLCPSL